MSMQILITEISKSGLTDSEIAFRLSTDDDKVPQSIVTRWKNGVIKSTGYERFLRIKNLHQSVTDRAA